jgi:hypothetical protein
MIEKKIVAELRKKFPSLGIQRLGFLIEELKPIVKANNVETKIVNKTYEETPEINVTERKVPEIIPDELNGSLKRLRKLLQDRESD